MSAICRRRLTDKREGVIAEVGSDMVVAHGS
jgi:hypothetical protein